MNNRIVWSWIIAVSIAAIIFALKSDFRYATVREVKSIQEDRTERIERKLDEILQEIKRSKESSR